MKVSEEYGQYHYLLTAVKRIEVSENSTMRYHPEAVWFYFRNGIDPNEIAGKRFAEHHREKIFQ